MSLLTGEQRKLTFRFAGLLALFFISPIFTIAQTQMDTHQRTSLDLKGNLGLQNLRLDSLKTDTSQVSDTASVGLHQKSGLEAVLLSAAIPGGGQVYNGSYWKVPIIIGVQAFFVSQWISNNKTYQYYRSQYVASLINFPPDGNISLQQERDSYRDQRDSYAWYIAGVYMLSMLDAYVDAELSGFDVSPGLGAAPAVASVAVSLRIKF